MAHELVVRHGTVLSATETLRCDVGVDEGRITALGERLPPGRRELDAAGLYVLPGGVDSHCHLEQLSSAGVMCADDFYPGTVSTAFGGTTTVVPFAAQHRGMKLRAVVEDYHRRAGEKAVIDYAFHLIVADPSPVSSPTAARPSPGREATRGLDRAGQRRTIQSRLGS